MNLREFVETKGNRSTFVRILSKSRIYLGACDSNLNDYVAQYGGYRVDNWFISGNNTITTVIDFEPINEED